jgi:hypothetical protein
MSDFAFTLPKSDSATLRLDPLTSADGTAPDLTAWSLTFTAGAIVKTSAAGQVAVLAPGNIVTVTIVAGDFPTAGALSASLVGTSGTSQATWYGTVVILDAAALGDLVTIGEVVAYQGGPRISADDELLEQLIASSSAWVVSRLGQEVLARTVVEPRDGDGTTRLLLRQFPVNSVTSVTVDGATIPKRTTTDGEGWILSRDGIDLIGYSFTAGLSNVVIVYSAGYATCPDDLRLAVMRHVLLQYWDRRHIGKASATLAGDSATYSDAGTLAYVEGVIENSPLKVWVVG